MKKILLIALAFALTLGIYADVVIGTGTSIQRQPFGSYFGYERSASLYTAGEINATGTITHLEWYVGRDDDTIIPTKIYLTTTTNTTMTSTAWDDMIDGLTPVFEGDLQFDTPGWHQIDITDFPYNHQTSGNLLVICETNYGGGGSGYSTHPQFHYTTSSATTGRHQYWNVDTNPPTTQTGTVNSYLPNITLVGITDINPPSPTMALNPADGATLVNPAATLNWNSLLNATGYKLYFGTTNPPAYIGDLGDVTTYNPNGMADETTYYWQVVPYNTYGEATNCPIWSFTTTPAGVVMIGDGTVNQYMPVNTFYGYSYAQSIYLQEDINVANQRIETISYYWNGVGAAPNSNEWVIYMGHTDEETFASTSDWVPVSELTPVYSGTVNIPAIAGWITINLTNPFVYNNTQNLVIAVDENKASYDSSSYFFFNTNTPGENRSIRAYSDSTNPDPANPPTGASQSLTAAFPNILMEFGDLPTVGVPSISPSPVAMGSSYLGFSKTQQVALTNTGGAALTVNSITLASTVDFQLQNLPTLPFTINPGDPAVPFTVVFNPTTAGELSTQLIIGDTRANSSFSVTGTGVQPLEGEICENPYIATLPLVDYNGTTDGYANDYTADMFTGLSATGYVSGKDWVAKITVPALGNLSISLADQTGYSSQWMGMFLVNTIPSLDNPAVVLAQAYGSSTPLNITNYNATPGDYYLIVDNYPSPASVYFVLNISFVEATDPPGPATLVAPADEAIGVSATPTLSWVSGGGVVEKYYVSYGTVSPFTTVLNNYDNGTATTYPITSPLNYETEYWWKVSPWNSVAGYAENQETWTFTTMENPTISSFPFFEGFESGYTNGASVLGNWEQLSVAKYWTANNNQTTYNRTPRTGNWNATLQYSGESTLVRPIELEADVDYQIEFYARQDTTNPSYAWVQAYLGNAPTVAALNINIIPQTNLVAGDYQKISGTFSVDDDGIYYIGIKGKTTYDPWYISLDDITIREMIAGPPATPILTYPVDVATDMPIDGFNLTWEPDLNTGGVPDYYAVFMSQDEETIFDDHYFEVEDPFFNPVTDSEGEIVFAYEDRWYWTVLAANTDGESDPADIRSFQIQADPAITSFPWCEGFEGTTFPPAGWTMVDDDGDGENWYQFSVEPHTGNYSATSASYINYVGELYPDNWLITPPIRVPATGDYMVEYYVASQDANWPEEHYGFYVSTSGPALTNFTMISQETLEDGDWHQRSNPLTSYAGQTVHFAFRHFNSTDNYMMKIDDVCVREIPQAPVLSINPTEFNFGTTHTFTPTTPKVFTLSNIGIDTIDIGVGDIWLTGDVEGNFVLNAQYLPVEISSTEPYNFTVQFIPQSAGIKSATLNVQDNITRAVHTVALTGEAVEEPIASVIMLEGELYGADAAYLDWFSIYGDPTQTGYLHWDDSINRGAVGAGANQYHIAVMFGSEVMEHTIGQVLDGVMIHLNEEPQTVDYVKVWSGTDADIAPETLLATQAVSGLTVGWNYIPLSSPVPTTNIEALWVGYHVNGIENAFPGSTDGIGAVDGRGNLVELSSWTTLTASNIDGNWLIHAHFTDEAEYLMTRRPATLAAKAIHAQVMNQKDMRDLPLTAIQTVEMNRALRGFNIFRDNVQINAEVVPAYFYTDENLAPGTYYYAVQSVHDSANGPISYTVPVTIPIPPAPFALPFTEDWSEGMEENMWAAGSTNWVIDNSVGNLVPSMKFSWTPQVTDYSIPLTSYSFDATELTNVHLSFDLFLNNFSLNAENIMAWEVWDGNAWNRIDERTSMNGSISWTTLSYNISEYAANGVFKIRFVAYGEDSYQINNWNIDNISLYSLPDSIDPVTDLSVSQSGTDFILDWTAVDGAQWYAIYASEDPYSGFELIYVTETAGNLAVPANLMAFDKMFVRVTAGAGEQPALPIGRRN